MPLMVPFYLSKRSLPNASDVLYHDELVYFLPTGFHTLEIENVIYFSKYCQQHQVALPKVVWDFCIWYVENAEIAIECAEIVRPLRERHLKIVMATYARDLAAINRTRDLIKTHTSLLHAFDQADLVGRIPHGIHCVVGRKGQELDPQFNNHKVWAEEIG